MAALRGYFQGLHNMMPTAVSQVVEQSVRVAVMIALLLYLTGAGADAAGIAAGAMLGPAGGGIAGLGVMLLYWRSHRRGLPDRLPQAPLKNSTASAVRSAKQGVPARELLSYGLPVMLGALAVPLIGLVDVFTVPRLLTGAAAARQQRWPSSASITAGCRSCRL